MRRQRENTSLAGKGTERKGELINGDDIEWSSRRMERGKLNMKIEESDLVSTGLSGCLKLCLCLRALLNLGQSAQHFTGSSARPN